ncbi:MAG: hypothetical protein J7L07_10730 [Candidatus Odinarchaeota archaeon]|nr:hypothetical protein [Candidatus Odinarchaeota archaeon]
MISRLREIFKDYLEDIVSALMVRYPVVLIGNLTESTFMNLISIASPHRFFLNATNISEGEIKALFDSEATEKSKRVILHFSQVIPDFIHEISFGWVCTIEQLNKEHKLPDALIYDLSNKKLLKTKDFEAVFRNSVSLYLKKLEIFEHIYGAAETRTFANVIITSLLSQIEILINLLYPKIKSGVHMPEEEYINLLNDIFTYPEFIPIAFKIYSSDYHIDLEDIYVSFREICNKRIIEREKIVIKPDFLTLKTIFGREILDYLLSFALIGIPIVILTDDLDIIDKLINALQYILPNRKIILQKETTDIPRISEPHLAVYVDPPVLPQKDFDMIIVTKKKKIFEEISDSEFYLTIDLFSNEYNCSIDIPPVFSDALEFNIEDLMEEAIKEKVRKFMMQIDLILGITRDKTIIHAMYSSSISHLLMEDKLFLAGLLRAERPNDNFFKQFFRLFISIVWPHIPYKIKVKIPFSISEINKLVKEARSKRHVLRIFALSSAMLSEILYLDEVILFRNLVEIEKLLRRGIIEIELI